MKNTKKIGVLGEKITMTYLKSKGYSIIDRNFSWCASQGPPLAEIDIIAKKKNNFIFVEVKLFTPTVIFWLWIKSTSVNYGKLPKLPNYGLSSTIFH